MKFMYHYIYSLLFLSLFIFFSSCSSFNSSSDIAPEFTADSVADFCKDNLMKGEYNEFPFDSILVPALNYYENCIFTHHEELVYLYFARGKRDLMKNKYESAAVNFLEVEKHIDKVDIMPFFKAILYSDMAYLYHLQNDVKSSITNYQIAADIFNSINDSLSYAVMLTRLGFEYSSSENFELAHKVFIDTKDYLQSDSTHYGQLLHMMGVMYYYQDSIEISSDYMRASLKYGDCDFNIATRHNILARNLLDLHQLDSSEYHCFKAISLSHSALLNKTAYHLLYKSSLLKGDANRAQNYNDSVLHFTKITEEIAAQPKFEVLREKEYLVQTVSRQNKILIILVIVLVLISFILFCMYYFFKCRITQFEFTTKKQQIVLSKQKKYADVLEQKHLMYELKQSNDFQMQKYHVFKASLYLKLSNKVPQYSKPGNFEKARPIYEAYLRLNDWDTFIELFDIELNGFVSKLLKSYFPSYTARSKNIIYSCCLIFLDVQDIDIALLLGYASINSFLTSKKRLKTRFHLSSTKDLQTFFEKVMLS